MHWTTCLFFTLLLLPAGETSGGQKDDFPTDLAEWLVRRPPVDEGWITANHDTKPEWHVFLDRDRRPSARLRAVSRNQAHVTCTRQESYPKMPFKVPQGTAEDGLAGEWFSVEVSDGWLIGFNAGEFGAGLWWFSPDGKKRYKISNDQVIGFFETKEGTPGPGGHRSYGAFQEAGSCD